MFIPDGLTAAEMIALRNRALAETNVTIEQAIPQQAEAPGRFVGGNCGGGGNGATNAFPGPALPGLARAQADAPTVTVGLPVYDGERYLSGALDSLLQQDYPNLQVLVCDNASTDSTPAICEEYAAKDSRVQVHRNATNIGASRNFERVFQLSTGRYFAWAAYDDRWDRSYISKCVAELERHPEAVLCFSEVSFIDEKGGPAPTVWHQEGTLGMDVVSRVHSLFKRWGWYAVYGVMRPEALKQVRIFQQGVGPDLCAAAGPRHTGAVCQGAGSLVHVSDFRSQECQG